MKTTLLLVLLVLTGLDLQAQTPPNFPARRVLGNGGTNGGPSRFPPRSQGAPGLPGVPGAAPGRPGAPGAPGGEPLSTAYNASSAFAAQQDEMIQPGLIDFEGVELTQVLDIYAKLVNKTLLRGALPDAKIILKTQTPLTKTEAIQALQAVLALNGVSLVNMGEKFVKVVPSDQAGGMGGAIDHESVSNIPSLGSYITRVVQLHYVKPSEMVNVVQPFARLNSILPIDGNGILIIRDYAENVKRMMEMIEQVDVSVPAEYISDVIPIRYAKVDDIANALNALGGGGGAIASIGTAPSSGQISGFGNRGMSGLGGTGGGLGGGLGGSGYGGNGYGGTGFGGGGYGTQQNSFNRATPNGTPSNGQSFQQRLNSIINGTSGGSGGQGGNKDQIQLFGQTKIIPNESSSTLLIYATRADMATIKGIIAKLDVPLAQVLIEAVIMDVTLGNTFNFGVSAAQNPAALSPGGSVLGGGGMANSTSPFLSFLRTVTSVTNGLQTNGLYGSISHITSVTSTSGTNGTFGNNLPGGLSYFANIGPYFDVAVSAAETDNHADIIQRPRIQTSQAKPAQFFVGNTVPYVTGTSYGYGGYGGNSYAQLSVGVELDVTPFINPEGLVVMDIQQEIDALNGYTAIANVGNVPNTIKRTLNTEIAVRNLDTVMLGGFITSDKSHTVSGVPFLSDIPILGNLFQQRSDSKDREELIVLMRPTVLDTPKDAAEHTRIEEQRLPGVSEAAAEDGAYERSLIEAERKREAKEFKRSGNYEGFFGPLDNSTNNPLKGPAGPVGGTNALIQPDTGAEVVTPVPQPVHPQAGIAPAPGAPGAGSPGAPAGNNNAAPGAPLSNSEMQQKSQDALLKLDLNSSSTNGSH
ncbi:MAG TPA: secretin N-terminal domain-containing protein [Candidatus Acidoferrales bacterium]|nr:secretin N-terminal domain-containing protein [Candidatus Acidoferrales bacterium]